MTMPADRTRGRAAPRPARAPSRSGSEHRARPRRHGDGEASLVGPVQRRDHRGSRALRDRAARRAARLRDHACGIAAHVVAARPALVRTPQAHAAPRHHVAAALSRDAHADPALALGDVRVPRERSDAVVGLHVDAAGCRARRGRLDAGIAQRHADIPGEQLAGCTAADVAGSIQSLRARYGVNGCDQPAGVRSGGGPPPPAPSPARAGGGERDRAAARRRSSGAGFLLRQHDRWPPPLCLPPPTLPPSSAGGGRRSRGPAARGPSAPTIAIAMFLAIAAALLAGVGGRLASWVSIAAAAAARGSCCCSGRRSPTSTSASGSGG